MMWLWAFPYCDELIKFRMRGFVHNSFFILVLTYNWGAHAQSSGSNTKYGSGTAYGYTGNTSVGYYAGGSMASNSSGATSNTLFGNHAGRLISSGDHNTLIGDHAGKNLTTGSRNVYIGKAAGHNHNKSGNVHIGYNAGYNNNSNDKLYIDNSSTATPLIYGDFASNRIGINKNNPSYTLDVGGSIRGSSYIRLGTARIHGSANRAGLLKVYKNGSETWSGISIEHSSTSAWSVMGDQNDFALYDDYNNEYFLNYNENSSLDLYHNGSKKLSTASNGISVTGDVAASGTVSASGGNSGNWNTAYSQRGSQIAGEGLEWSSGSLRVTGVSGTLSNPVDNNQVETDNLLLWPDQTPEIIDSNLEGANLQHVLVREPSSGTIKYRSSDSMMPWVFSLIDSTMICNPGFLDEFGENLSLNFLDLESGSLKIGQSAWIDNDSQPGGLGDNWIGFSGQNGHVNISSASANHGIRLQATDNAESYLNLLQSGGDSYLANSVGTGGGAFPDYFIKGTADNNVEVPKDIIISGIVQVGSTTPPAGYKMAIDGNLIANRVRVDNVGDGWPDYVFEEDYDLTPLSEIEQYIKRNRHLPNMPSASEVANEGIELGDMNAKLLRKIEELTLHMISQEKRNVEQENRILELQQQNNLLSEKLIELLEAKD